MMQKDNFFWVGGKNTIHEIAKWKKRTIKQILSTKKINTSNNLQETLVDPKKINKILVNAVGFGGNAVSVLLSEQPTKNKLKYK